VTRSTALDFVEAEIRKLAEEELVRRPAILPPNVINLSSNDYLGLAKGPAPATAGGAAASPLVTGYTEEHVLAERAVVEWLGVNACLLFSSGYAANVGTIAALAGPGDVIFSDELNHASIIDGCRLSKARIVIHRHRDLAHLRSVMRDAAVARRKFVVTESYFSMDGDCADLAGLRALTLDEGAALIVDEAHALGVFGPAGQGLCAAAGVTPDVMVGPLGKAFGLQGAFVASTESVKLWLWNRARSFVFSTALSPALAAMVPERVEKIRLGDARRARVLEASGALRSAIQEAGGHVLGAGPIIPWVLGEPGKAVAAQRLLLERGVWASAIRPPTVPVGSARLRLAPSASLTSVELERATAALRSVAETVLR
jgi:8-amino-7-oxononanoate synthase